ncbi:Uncharacterised protein [Yersinia pseudotuberculosis]|nr:Uncharacterised protein [Yersinia pseudotuberculosis]
MEFYLQTLYPDTHLTPADLPNSPDYAHTRMGLIPPPALSGPGIDIAPSRHHSRHYAPG